MPHPAVQETMAMNVVLLKSVNSPLIKEPHNGRMGANAMPENDRNPDQYRPRHDDEYSRREQGQPKNVADLFWRLGYDINNTDDLHRLAADFRWVSDERQKASERWPHRFTLYVSIVTAVIGASVTAAMQWLVNRH